MKIYNGFMLFIAIIVFITLGICLISFGVMGQNQIESLVSFLRFNSGLFSIVGIVLILLSITEIILVMKNLGKIPVVAFSNPLGEVRVAYEALEDYVKNLSTEIAEIKDARPQIVAGRDGIEIHTRLVVERDVNLPELTSRFQDLVSRYVKDVMGIDSITSIQVYIQKISSKKSLVAEEEKKPSEEETV